VQPLKKKEQPTNNTTTTTTKYPEGYFRCYRDTKGRR